MKRLLGVFLIVCLIIVPIKSVSATELDLEKDKPIPAKVLEVIEANVYRLLIFDSSTPRVETYSLIGVKSDGNKKAYDYSVDKLLNQVVYFLEDKNISEKNGIKYCYLYKDFNISHNEDLVKRGLASVDNSFQSAKSYLKFNRSQEYAKQMSLGMYDFSDRPASDRILNINAAGIEQIAKHFSVDTLKASAWYARIAANPINQLAELRALDPVFFTSEKIYEYAPSIHLRTDLQSALPYELDSLTAKITDSSRITDKIILFRLYQDKITEKDFEKLDIALSHRQKLLPYITFTKDSYSYTAEMKVVNINTANEEQIEAALNVSASQAIIIRDFRRNLFYPLRSVEELFKPHFPLNKDFSQMDTLSDNIHLMTNVNQASEMELRSLFGKINIQSHQLSSIIKDIIKQRPFKNMEAFQKIVGKTYASQIQDYIYFDTKSSSVLYNLNTSGNEVIAKGLNLSDSQRRQLNRKFTNPKEIPSFLEKNIHKITLYTNINQAGYEELMNLSPNMTKALAEDIIRFRSGGGFYAHEDIKMIFENHNRLETYLKIRDYIVLQ